MRPRERETEEARGIVGERSVEREGRGTFREESELGARGGMKE